MPVCPHCDRRPALRDERGFLDWLAGWVLLRPYRCFHCGRRFYRFGRACRPEGRGPSPLSRMAAG